jgi:hypothetical protein
MDIFWALFSSVSSSLFFFLQLLPPHFRTTIMRRIRFSRCLFSATVLRSDLEQPRVSTDPQVPSYRSLVLSFFSSPSFLFPWPHFALRLEVSQIINALLFFRASHRSCALHFTHALGLETALSNLSSGFQLFTSRPIPDCRLLPTCIQDGSSLCIL